jgi:lysophospholipase L1-like esterase
MNRSPMAKLIDGLQKAGLLLTACLAALLLAEAALVLADLSFPVFDVYDEMLGVKLMPGKKGWYRKEGAAFLEINSLGYRDVEHALSAPPERFRVAVLGDSFTEARQMPIEATYWHRLGEELGACPALAGREIEVLNFGIGGYSTAQELLAYRIDARRFEPDLVLLGFFAGNDVRENSRTLNEANMSWRAPKPYYDLVDGELRLRPPAPPPFLARLIFEGVQHSRLLEMANEARRQWSVRKKRAEKDARLQAIDIGLDADVYQPTDGLPEVEDAWTLTARLLAELHHEVRADGAHFMVATIPSAEQTHPNTGYREAVAGKLGVDDLLLPERRLAAFGRADGYAVFPLVAEMQARVGKRHFHGFDNTDFGHGHMNADGHRAMAALLAPKVCDELARSLAPAGPHLSFDGG